MWWQKKKKTLSILPVTTPAIVPSLKPFYERLPPLPKGKQPLADSFINFDRNLTYDGVPRNHQSVLARAREHLNNEFTVRTLLEAGSSRSGTGIKGKCDIDYIVCFRYNRVDDDSRDFLKKVYNSLLRQFGSAVKLDSPAVTIHYGSSEAEQIDIVPAFTFEDQDYYAQLGYSSNQRPSSEEAPNGFFIPGFDGDWVATNPKSHIEIINKADNKQRGKLRRAIRLLKAWKYGNHLPITSYFLESFAFHLAQEEEFSHNPHLDLFKILCCLNVHFKQRYVAIVDPNIYSNWGRIVPCAKEHFHQIKVATERAAFNATSAMDAEWNGRIDIAIQQWHGLFGGTFQ